METSRREFLKVSAFAGAALTLPWRNTNCQNIAPEVSLTTFEQRRDWVLDAAVADPLKHGGLFWTAQACFLRGKIETGLAVWREAVQRETKARVRGVELFNYWPAIDCILRWGHLLDAEGKAEIKRLLTTFREYSTMRTSNLVTLAQVTRHLAGQAFGEADFIPESHYRPDDHDASKALRKLIAKCAREGFGEWASWPYYDKNILPILSIAELSADPALKNMARITFEAGLAQNAAFWLHGRWAMSTGRSYPDILSQKPWGGPQMLWLYFGGTMPDVGGYLVGAAVMNYRPPALIECAASDRARAYTARSHFWKNQQTSYIDRDYGLFSEAQTQIVDWHQSYPYGVIWDDATPAHTSFLWLTAPLNDTPQTVSPSHPHGVNSHAQTNLQHESALLYVFRFPEKTACPYALGFVPGGALSFMDDSARGHLFLHYATVLIAISSSVPFAWDRSAKLRAPSGKPMPGDSEFRVYPPQENAPFAMAIECAHPADFPAKTPTETLAAFCSKIIADSRISVSETTGVYRDRRGNQIERTFAGPGKINGVEGDFTKALLLENPWMRQPIGGPLTLGTGAETQVYDFNQWTVTSH